MRRSSSTAGRRVPGDRPLPLPSSPKGVSFPGPEVCQALDKLWLSRGYSLPQPRDYYADNVQIPDPNILQPHELPITTTTLRNLSITDTSSSSTVEEAVTKDTIEEVSQTPSDHSRPTPIFARVFPSWQLWFFVRLDCGGTFHTYPPLGGPFQNLQEADDAIARHLDERRSPMMCTDGLSRSEICVRSILYWPDGTRKSFNPTDRRNVNLMVHSLLDRYNEDHHLSGDLAYELEDVVSFSEIYDRGFKRRHVFYHINFTTKNKGPEGLHSGDDGNLFFAEITCLIGENEEYVLDCLCVVKPDDKGQCYGCKNFGSVDLKHPTDAHKYKRGHSKPYPRCCGFDLPREMLDGFCTYRDEDTRLAAEESRLRRIYKCLDDPVFVAKLDDERKAADVGSSKREDNQGKGLAKYVVPARRRQLR